MGIWGRRGWGAVLLLSLLGVACGRQDFRARAGEAVAKARAELASMSEVENDPTVMLAHQQAAHEALAEARALYERAGAARTPDAELRIRYAEVLTLMGDHDLAAEALRPVVKAHPENRLALWALGESLVALGPRHVTEATRSLNRLLELEPPADLAVAAHLLLARVYTDQGLYDLARESRVKALELKPDEPRNRIAIAALDVREGKLKEASDTLDSFQPLNPELQAVLRVQLPEALAAFEYARIPLSDDAAQHLAYAKLLIWAGRIDDSLWPLDRSLELEPNNYIGWNMLGSITQGLGQVQRAREAFEKSLEVNPDQPRTREALDQLNSQPAPVPSMLAPGVTPAQPGPSATAPPAMPQEGGME